MSYTSVEARQQLLDAFGEAADNLAHALAALGAAYEQLDDQQADRLEEQLFRPVQRAYGRAQGTHAGVARRYGLPARAFTTPPPGAPADGVKGCSESSAHAVGQEVRHAVAL